jgi:HEAT repeat protein
MVVLALVALLLTFGSASAQGARPKTGSGKDDTGSSLSTGPTGAKRFAGKTLQEWIAETKHGDASKRTLAVLAIMQPVFNEENHLAVPALLNLLSDPDVSPRAKACHALRTVEVKGNKVDGVVKALAARLRWLDGNEAFRAGKRGWREPESAIRYEAAATLRRFASDAGKAIPSLIDGTRDSKSCEVRYMCASVLWRAAQGTSAGTDPDAVKALLKLFTNSHATYQERLEIVIGLGSLKKPSDPYLQSEVIKVLTSATRTTARGNKPLAIWAYAGLVVQAEPSLAKTSLSAISRFLTPDHDLEVRSQAVQALAALGPERARSRIPAIIAMLKDKEAVIVDGACQALARMNDHGDKVIDALLRVAGHQDPYRAASAVSALATMKANSRKVIDTLEQAAAKEKAKKDSNTALVKLIQDAIKYIQKKDDKPAKVAPAAGAEDPRPGRPANQDDKPRIGRKIRGLGK